jgi:DNA-binding NarL/FixJ family response regulator
MKAHFGACFIRTGLCSLCPDRRAKLRMPTDQPDKVLQRIVRQGVEDGSLRPCDPKLVSFAIFSGFNSVATWYREDGEVRPAAIFNAYLDLFLNGLLPPGCASASERRLTKLLTERQYQIVELASKGFSDKEIAARLGIGFPTVRTHINSAFQKLQVNNRVKLCRIFGGGRA